MHWWTSLVSQMVKRLPTMWETRVQSLGQEDPLEKEMATHSSILGLENPMDEEAWQATGHGVAKSRTRLSNFTFMIIRGSPQTPAHPPASWTMKSWHT